MQPVSIIEDYCMTPKDVAQRLKVAQRTLQGWRDRKIGPSYLIFQRQIRYSKSSLERWLLSKVVC